MNLTNHLLVLIFIFSTALAGCSREQQPTSQPGTPLPAVEPADLLLTNAYVYTVDNSRTVAEAVAIRGNEIIYVGSDGERQQVYRQRHRGA